MLPKETIREQAEALDDFVQRGGDLSSWFHSKDFSSADKIAILKARRESARAK